MKAERYEMAGTEKTPAVLLDPVAGVLVISGCSVPENADGFYGPLLDSIERYAAHPASRTVARVSLSYFNSSTSKYLLDIFKAMEDIHLNGSSGVTVEWHHEADDLDMREAGEDYRSLLEVPVKLVADAEGTIRASGH
jgi:hypothetical protein